MIDLISSLFSRTYANKRYLVTKRKLLDAVDDKRMVVAIYDAWGASIPSLHLFELQSAINAYNLHIKWWHRRERP